MTKTLLGLFLFLIFPSIGFTNENAIQEQTTLSFQTYAKQIPTVLIQNGNIRKIGNLDLQNLIKEIDQIQVIEKDWVETPTNGTSSRIFARWEITESGPVVYLNKKVWDKLLNERIDFLALHEVLGGAGYDDNDYNLSLSLWILSKNVQDPQLHPEITKRIKDYIDAASKSNSGGVVGVGGGGDATAVYLKTYLVNESFKQLKASNTPENQSAFYNDYVIAFNLKVEVTWKTK